METLTVELASPSTNIDVGTGSADGCICIVITGTSKEEPFQVGDEIVSIDGKPVSNILLAKKLAKTGTTFVVKRREKLAIQGKKLEPAGLTTHQPQRRQEPSAPAHHGAPPAHHGASPRSVLLPRRQSSSLDLIGKAKVDIASSSLAPRRRNSFSNREKHMRLFISSSFVDMRTERDLLMKHVFPKIRSACLALGAQFTEVDLRWGIDEQSEMPQVLATCLTEVVRCEPFILCILGHRYGWRPPRAALEEASGLAPNLGWTLEACGSSITHLEAMAGILRLPEAERKGLVYLRSDSFLETLDPRVRSEYETQDEDGRQRLQALKAELTAAKGVVVRTYNRPEDLPHLVMEDLLGRCQAAFADEALTDPYQQDNFSHNAFGASRAATYIPFPHLEQLIECLLAGKTSFPALILGDSGTGKSSIMAAFLDRLLERQDTLTFFHFIGHSSHSAHHVNVMKRLLYQLKQWAPDAITDAVPSAPAQLVTALPSWISTVASVHKDKTIFICLDALNQLQNIDNAHSLTWLPQVYPRNVKLVLSSTSCDAAEAVARRTWAVTKMPLIGDYERITYALLFLNQRGKDLSPERLNKIISVDHVKSLLHLKLMLEELQIVANFDTLDAHIDHLLLPTSLPAFFGLVLSRLEATFGRDFNHLVCGPAAKRGIVGTIMAYVACARHGITEVELLDILGVARSQIATLMFAVEEFLQINTGYLLFAHEAFLKAVQAKYLSTEAHRVAVHGELAAYFSGLDAEKNARVCAELPWHLLLSRRMDALCQFLSRIPIYQRMRSSEFLKLELASFWREIGLDKASAAYRASLARHLQENMLVGVAAAELISTLASGLHEWGQYSAAEELFQQALEQATRNEYSHLQLVRRQKQLTTDDDTALTLQQAKVLGQTLVAFARLRTHQSKGHQAQALLRRALPLYERVFGKDSRESTQVLDDLAWNLIMEKQLRGSGGAVALLRQSLKAKLQEMQGPTLNLNALSELDVLLDLDAPSWQSILQTLTAHPKQVPRTVPPALNRLALAYSNLGHMRIAEQLFQCSLLLHRSLWGDRHPQVALVLGDLGSLYARQLTPVEGASLAPSEIYLYDMVDVEREDASQLNMDATTLFVEAQRCYEEALSIRTEALGRQHPFTATSLKGLGDLLCRKGDNGGAVALYQECYEIRLDALGTDNKQTQLVRDRLRELGQVDS
eukprot:m.180346 g.180346  ORF g.180346 m.180346 type:complete len:1190 (+) comp16614_c4_seq1:1862-5431(+)